MVKEFLSRKGVEFEVVDVATLEDPIATLRSVTGGPVGTPTVVIAGEAHLGFDPEWMEAQLVSLAAAEPTIDSAVESPQESAVESSEESS